MIVVSLKKNGIRGRGECRPIAYKGESIEQTLAEIESLSHDLKNALSREELQERMPPGAARNAIDCALWDLESKQKNIPVWQLAGLNKPEPVLTAFTIGIDTPEKMIEKAKAHNHYPLLKIKLSKEIPFKTLEGIRLVCPDSDLIVDANQDWPIEECQNRLFEMKELKIQMVEQPVDASEAYKLASINQPVMLCADESCNASDSLEELTKSFGMINIKLDKTGGLTEALKTVKKAQELNLKIMVGCMLASSLSMAPALLLSQFATYLDLDGPLLLERDCPHALHCEGSIIHPASRELWG